MNKKRKSISYAKWGYIFLIPFFLVYCVFSLYPLITTFVDSFFDIQIDQGFISFTGQEETSVFCGLDNYIQAFQGDLGESFVNTFVIWIMGFIPQIIISLLLAAWFTDLRLKIKLQGFFKAIIYLPNILMASAVSYLFWSLFSQGGGIWTLIHNLTGYSGVLLDTPWGAKSIVAIINFLLWYGNTTILLMAAIMGVDTSLYESAQIDGANSRQTFRKITLPLIRPILLYVLITSLIGGIQLFDVPQIMGTDTGQPAGALMTLVMQINIRKNSTPGLASAICIIIFVATAILGGIIFFTTSDRSDKKYLKKQKKAAKAAKEVM